MMRGSLMTRRMLLRATAAVLLLPLASFASRMSAQEGPSLVILARHAEKAVVPGNDPPLSELGRERAAALATALLASPPSAIVVSSLQRTALTADVVAQTTGVKPTIVTIEGSTTAHVAAVAAAVRAQRGVVLVVGHSNTVPAIIKALGGPSLPDICDATYSHLFVLKPAAGAQPASLVIARYGATEAAPPATCAGMVPK